MHSCNEKYILYSVKKGIGLDTTQKGTGDHFFLMKVTPKKSILTEDKKEKLLCLIIDPYQNKLKVFFYYFVKKLQHRISVCVSHSPKRERVGTGLSFFIRSHNLQIQLT